MAYRMKSSYQFYVIWTKQQQNVSFLSKSWPIEILYVYKTICVCVCEDISFSNGKLTNMLLCRIALTLFPMHFDGVDVIQCNAMCACCLYSRILFGLFL